MLLPPNKAPFFLVLTYVAFCLFGCGNSPKARLDAAIAKGTDFLISLQQPSGAINDTANPLFEVWETLVALEALQESVRELQAVIKRYKAMEAGLKYKLESSMRTLGQTKLAGDRYEFKYVGCQKSLDIVDASAVPAQFLLPPEPNNMAIKAALSNGVDVPGARLAGGTYLKCSAVSKQ